MAMLVIGSGASAVDVVREADGSDPDCWKLASFLFPRQIREWQSGMGTRGESRWCVLVDATEEELDHDDATVAYRTVNDFDLALGACVGADYRDDVLRVEAVERMVDAGAIGHLKPHDVAAFARASVEADRKACELAGTQMDDVWTGEHTTALAAHLGRKPTEDEIDLAANAYAEAAR